MKFAENLIPETLFSLTPSTPRADYVIGTNICEVRKNYQYEEQNLAAITFHQM